MPFIFGSEDSEDLPVSLEDVLLAFFRNEGLPLPMNRGLEDK
jgi:hypothetical protein